MPCGNSIVTYWIHRLQHIADETLFVSLIPGFSTSCSFLLLTLKIFQGDVKGLRLPRDVVWQSDMTHPRLSGGAFVAQRAIVASNAAGGSSLADANDTTTTRAFLCGAWLGTCFHEAGAASGMRAAADALRATLGGDAGAKVPFVPLWPDAAPRRCWVFDDAVTAHRSLIAKSNRFSYRMREVCFYKVLILAGTEMT